MTKYVLTMDAPPCARCGSTDYFRATASDGVALVCGTCTDDEPRPGEQERAIIAEVRRTYGLAPSDTTGTT